MSRLRFLESRLPASVLTGVVVEMSDFKREE